jgi:exonuclease SbcC
VHHAGRYIESVIGMDDHAFRASVFTEQKQLAAFSDHTPSERRVLVMQLLGITPLDSARDSARRDARDLATDHDRLRGMLADLASLATEADDAAAAADAARTQAAIEAQAAAAFEERTLRARRELEAADARRQENDSLLSEGRAVRDRLDKVTASALARRGELADLDALEAGLDATSLAASGVDEAESALDLLLPVLVARAALDRIVVGPEPSIPDSSPSESATLQLATSREEVAATRALLSAAETDLTRAVEASARSDMLTGEADCPMCGQALGKAFETVQAHREREVAEAGERVSDLRDEVGLREVGVLALETEATNLAAALDLATKERSDWEQAADRHWEAASVLISAWEAAVAGAAGTGAQPPPADELDEHTATLRARVESARAAQSVLQRILGRLEGRPAIVRSLEEDVAESAALEGRRQTLLDKVHALGFSHEELERCRSQSDAAEAALRRATAAANEAAVHAAVATEKAASALSKLDSARQQHSRLGDLESRARHVGRTAELLSDFRNTVVASVGPRLAVEAAELFADLTDHEYERLEVDAETYELQINDGGRSYGLDRFSGSEIDLANLALRVAISEHIHFQSGGSVGLLVLDEVFGPLDEDRKGRMLLALETLKGRFRQVLVVTHDPEIKEQLPHAIEVVKLPGRRATARLLGD